MSCVVFSQLGKGKAVVTMLGSSVSVPTQGISSIHFLLTTSGFVK